ncbi:hypothetical protein FACS189430_09650 [Bacteroidia bacterium]|nr:hypothetical protein FACS189430_09650 [Bacteroidia bacterium]
MAVRKNVLFLKKGLRMCQILLHTVSPNISPARLMAMLPVDLPAGEYAVQVRSSYLSGGKTAKTLKTGQFHKILIA